MGVEDWQNPSCWLLHLLVILRGAIVICETMLFEKAHDSGLHVSLSCFNPQVIDVTANFVDPIVFVGWILYFDEFVGKLAHVFIGSIQSCWGSMGFQTIQIPHLSPPNPAEIRRLTSYEAHVAFGVGTQSLVEIHGSRAKNP